VSGPDVVPLDATDASVAEAIRELMALGYAVEAARLGVADFPPLRRTAAHIAASGARFLGVWDADTLVAVAEVERPASGRVHLGSLVVRPTHFRRGLASALLRRVLDGDGGDEFTVSTGVRNEPALRLYAAHGLAVVRRWTTSDGIPMVTLRRPRDRSADAGAAGGGADR
jgi:GNAT superfamily N-acetyltransferase